MAFKPNLLMAGALLCIGALVPASAQTVYKCGSRKSVTYTEQPCSNRIVNTSEAAVPVPPNRSRSRVTAMRQRAGESAGQFETRRRRARLTKEDRDECARIDVRMPVEEASLKNPNPEEVQKAEAALATSRKRLGELRC